MFRTNEERTYRDECEGNKIKSEGRRSATSFSTQREQSSFFLSLFSFLPLSINLSDLKRVLWSVVLAMVVMMPVIVLLLVRGVVLIALLLVLLRRNGLQNVIGSFLGGVLLAAALHRVHGQPRILDHRVRGLRAETDRQSASVRLIPARPPSPPRPISRHAFP